MFICTLNNDDTPGKNIKAVRSHIDENPRHVRRDFRINSASPASSAKAHNALQFVSVVSNVETEERPTRIALTSSASVFALYLAIEVAVCVIFKMARRAKPSRIARKSEVQVQFGL